MRRRRSKSWKSSSWLITQMSDFFSSFVADADAAINSVMSRPYVLLLKDGNELQVDAIWDTSLQEAKTSASTTNPRSARAVSDRGVLTVLQNRINRERVLGAELETPLGTRWVVDVDYLDETTTVLLLGFAGDANLPSSAGVRFVKG